MYRDTNSGRFLEEQRRLLRGAVAEVAVYAYVLDTSVMTSPSPVYTYLTLPANYTVLRLRKLAVLNAFLIPIWMHFRVCIL